MALQEEVIMELLSAEYGWTPQEIKNTDLNDIDNYLQIIKAKRKEEIDNQKKYGRQ